MSREIRTSVHEEHAVGVVEIGGTDHRVIFELTVEDLEEWGRKLTDLAAEVDVKRCQPFRRKR